MLNFICYIIMFILWFGSAFNICADTIEKINSRKYKSTIYIVCFIIIIGTPFFVAVTALENILDIFLDDG